MIWFAIGFLLGGYTVHRLYARIARNTRDFIKGK